MERIEGQTLNELMARKGLRRAEALTYAVQIAHALGRAHAAGILHRDLKPSNVMVTQDGRVKVLDFGLAKLLELSDSSADASTMTAHTVTEEGAVVGTIEYMSPEQAEGRTLDPRSDIFSFGSMLYEMVTGRRPFRGETKISTLTKIVSEDPMPPTQLIASTPPELERIILRCLRKDPARRYQTMADLRVALEDVHDESSTGKPMKRLQPSRRWIWPAVVVLLLLAAAVLAWRNAGSRESKEPLQALPLITLPGVQRYPSFSPDGNYVAFTWTGPKQDNPDIYVQQIGAGAPLRLTEDPGNDYNPVWSPDGRSIAFLRLRAETQTSEVRLIPPLRGPEQKVAEIHVRSGMMLTPPYLTWCPQSNCLIATDSPGENQPDALFVISLEAPGRRQLTNPQDTASGDTHPAVSPDGRWLVFRRNLTLFSGELHRLQLGSGITAQGKPVRITPAALDANQPAWMPDSKEIVFSNRLSLWRLPVAGQNTPARLPFVGEDGLMPAVSRVQGMSSPRLAYIRSMADVNIWRIDTSTPGAAASSPPVVSIHSTRREGMPHLSPDGRRVAFFSDRLGPGGIWIADLDGANPIPIAAMGQIGTGYPHWSPDGKWLVFHSAATGQVDVYLVPSAGGKPRNLTPDPARDSYPSFSGDGKWIYFTSSRAGDDGIWKIPAFGGKAVQVTRSAGRMPAESPDGRWLYYVDNVFTPGALWRVPVSGGVSQKVLDRVFLGNFVVLERGIYYIERPLADRSFYSVDQPTGEALLQYFDFATGRYTTVARNLGNVDTPLTASADGRTILFSREDSSLNDLMLVENFR
jgi:Tol biopolymer transport system component